MTNLQDLQKTAQAVKQEYEQRALILKSPEFLELEKKQNEIEQQIEDMLSVVPDSREEYEADKKTIIKEMLENGQTELEGFTVKIRNKKKVNTYKVLKAMDGDIDNLMLVSSVTQAALTKFIKDNDGYKHLKQCIEDDGYTITDILLAE